jgi:hypothetical protein
LYIQLKDQNHNPRRKTKPIFFFYLVWYLVWCVTRIFILKNPNFVFSFPVMAGLPPQHNNPAQAGGSKPILLQLEEQYTKRVDDDVLKLVDSFADIIRVAEVAIALPVFLVYESTALEAHILSKD